MGLNSMVAASLEYTKPSTVIKKCLVVINVVEIVNKNNKNVYKMPINIIIPYIAHACTFTCVCSCYSSYIIAHVQTCCRSEKQ